MTTNVNANFNYNANFGPVINQMRQLMSQANLLNQTLQNFDKQASGLKLSLGDSLASDIGKMGGWNTKVIELSDSVGQFGKALQKQELSLKQYAKEGIGAFSSASNAHKLAVREVAREMSQLAVLGEKNGKQMGMMITPTNINLKDFNTNLAVSRKQFDIFNTIVQDGATKLINFGKNTQWAGRQITVGLTVPISGFAAQMMKAFRDVNVELTRFQKVYGSGLMSSGDAETLKMTENVKQLGIEFSRTMGIAVKDTASLAAELAATGLQGEKLMSSLRETTRLATLGDVSNQDAMKTTLSLQNAFKISTDELAGSVDFLNAVENQTSLSLSDLTTAIPKAGPVVKALGGDVKDLSLLMVALKEGGISAAEGANALKSGMASLINPTKRATEIAAQYGINIKQIVQANRGQLMPTIIEFQKQLQLLDSFGKAQVIENIFGKYQFARISALFDNLNASSSQTMQVMELMGKSQKELAANSYLEMDTLMNSGAKRFQRATESIKSQFIDIGGSITASITPIIESVSSKIGKVIKFFEKLPAPVKSFIKVAVGIAAIAGPIIMIAGVFSNFLGYITKGAMSIVNLGRRMSGIPVEKFKMLDDTQIMAQKSTDALSQAFDLQKTSVERLNSVLAVYKQHLGDAITLNPNFVNVQVAQQTTTGNPPVPKFQKGGSAWVPGSGDGDKVPAMLEPGEFVVNKKAAAQNAGMLHDINFNQAPRFQSGGRVGSAEGGANSEKAGDYPEALKNLVKIWQQGPKGIRNNPDRLEQLMAFFYPIQDSKTLRRKTTLGVPGEMPDSQQLAIIAALESGNYQDIIGKRFDLKGKPSAYTEWGFDWLASKEFTGDPQKIEFARQDLEREQRGLKILQSKIASLNSQDPILRDTAKSYLENRLAGFGERGKAGATKENLDLLLSMYTNGISQSKQNLARLLPMGVDPMDIMIQREFKPGSRMLDVTRINPDEKYRGRRLMEREFLATPSRPTLESISQTWIPPERFIGGQRGYDQNKENMPMVLNMKQMGGMISSAEAGLKNGKPNMAIFDIDRTLADTADYSSAFKIGDISEWAKLTEGAPVIQRELQRLMAEKQSGKAIGLLTARSSEMDAMTLGWLSKNNIPYDQYWSRPAGDNRKDHIFKHQLLQQIMQKYNVTGLYDDKDSNLKAAEILGITGYKAFMTDKVQSAEAGWTQKEIEKSYSQYTDTKSQNHQFKGFGRGRYTKIYSDDQIWGSNPLNTAFHTLLPNAVGRSEEEKTQLNILRRYMSMFNITDPNQLDAGMQAALMEMFMVHGGDQRLGMDPSLIKTMDQYDRSSAQMEGPGTYFSSNLKTNDEAWNDFAGSHKYTISKTREAFRKVARGKGYIEAYDETTEWQEPSKQLKTILNSFSRTKSGKEAKNTRDNEGRRDFDKTHWLRDPASAAEYSGPGSPFYKYLVEKGYQGIKWSPATITNFNIGREGISLSPISNPSVDYVYDEDKQDYVDLDKPYQANIPDLSPVGYLKGGRVNNFESKSMMPQKYADRQAAIEEMLNLANLEATTGRFASMPVTDVGQRQSGMGGFSSAIPGVNGVYEVNGKKFIVKGHDTLDSALIESRGTQLTRDMFGLTTPEQELIKLGHPNTGQQMFGVRSPFDARFAKTSGQIAPDAFFRQALAAIIRGDADLQADNLFDGIVTDVGAGYVSDRASQPRTLSGKKNDVETQARINFLMQKGGARRWFAEATAGIAGSMSPEQYEAGFLNAIAQAQANAGGAIGALQNLTPEEKAMYELLQGDLSAASKIDWKAIHAHHAGVTPEPVKPKSAPTAKALEKKAADAAEREQALKAGFPTWMQNGGRVNNFAEQSMESRIEDYTDGRRNGKLKDSLTEAQSKKMRGMIADDDTADYDEYFKYIQEMQKEHKISSFDEGNGRGIKGESILGRRFEEQFLQTSLDTLLPNATGSNLSEEQQYQLNVLKRYMKMFGITSVDQLSPGMRASLFDAFAIHRSRSKNLKAVPIGKYDPQENEYDINPLEGPGTYFASSLRVSDTKWSEYAGDQLYTQSKTRDAFRKTARSKGYLNWENVEKLSDDFRKTKAGKSYRGKDIDEYTTPDDPFVKYLMSLGYVGVDQGASVHTNWLVGKRGYGLSSFKPTDGKVGYQSGGMVSSAANGYQFAHIVPPDKLGTSIHQTYPIGLDVPGYLNSGLNSGEVDKKDLIKNFADKKAIFEMTNSFGSFNKKFPEFALGSDLPKQIQEATVKTLSDAPDRISDEQLYKEAAQENIINKTLKVFKDTQYLRDVRANINEDVLIKNKFTKNKNGSFTSPDGSLTVYPKREGSRIKWKDASTDRTLGNTSGTDRRRTFPTNNPLYSILAQGKQSGGRVNGYADSSMLIDNNKNWKSRASAPKQYEGILRKLPDWATKGTELQAIVAALQSAGIKGSERLAGYYMRDALAHINPMTTNDGEVYTKVWEAMNLMKESGIYNTFIETLRSRKDIQSRGGLLAPQVVEGVMAQTGLSKSVVMDQLTKLSSGVHPNTREGGMVILALAKMFPSAGEGRGMPIGVAAGMQERLKGDFYETLQSRALPAGLPTVKKVTVNGESKTPQSRSRAALPGSPTMPKIVYPSMAGGSRMSGTGATVNVSPDGKILSNTIDDMLVTSASGHPLAVSSRELLAVTPEGTIAGVTSPGDEARKNIVHPMGTQLIRGKNFKAKSAMGGMSDAVYEGNIQPGNMQNFAASITSMIGVVGQLQFAFGQFTSEVENGTAKWVAGTGLAISSMQLFADNGMGQLGKNLQEKGFERQGLKQKLDPKTLQPMLDANGNSVMTRSNVLKPKAGGKLMSGLGSGMSKLASGLGNPLVQIGLQVGIAAVNKSIEIYQAEMEKARKAGNAAFAEPTETAKLMGVQLKSLTASAEAYGKAATNIFGAQGKGAYDKAFEKTVKTDYGDLIESLKSSQTEQEQLNQLVNVYSNLIQRGMDPKNAKEMTAEIARQGEALSAFNEASPILNKTKDPRQAMANQVNTLASQMDVLSKRRADINKGGTANLIAGVGQFVPAAGVAVRGGSMLATAATGTVGAAAGLAPQISNLFGSKEAHNLRKDAINNAMGIGGNNLLGKALGGLGDNALAQAIGGRLMDDKIKTQIAAQIGGTLKAAFAIAADNPVASNEAIRMVVSQFKNADFGKVKTEIANIAKEKGFGDLSEIGQYINSDSATNSFKALGEESQAIFIAAINTGMGPELEKLIGEGLDKASLEKEIKGKIAGKVAENQALVKIKAEVDLQLEDSAKQLELLKTAIQKTFEAAIDAKKQELDVEDKRHEKALANLDLEAERLGRKKEQLAQNTEYYLKELQRESQAEDYYAKQRETGIGGLKSLASGDVFGFIGAQAQAASQSDQFGRERSMQNIQETADAEQKKLDDALKAIDDRKKAEDLRHQVEVDNINNEIALLQKKESVTVGQINTALDLIEKAEKMSVGDKGYNAAVQAADTAAKQAGLTARVNTTGLKLAPGTDKETTSAFKSAQKDLKGALGIMAKDTTDAVDRLNDSGKIAANVFKSLKIDPKNSAEYKDLFKVLQRPADPKLLEAVNAFVYAKSDNQDEGLPKTAAAGGAIYGAGTATSDSIPAMLSNGEFVMNAASVKKYGVPMMNAINAKRYANGGGVGMISSSAPSMPAYASGGGVGVMPRTSVPNSPSYNVPSTPSVSPASIAGMAGGGSVGDMNSNSPNYNFNFNGAGMDMVMGHVNKAMGGTINNNSRGVYG